MTLTFGSLFSGIGGFDLGFERAGMTPTWQCEIDKAARSVLTRHWPDVSVYEDVRDVRSDNCAAVDLVCGGFPCQDLSVAGKRAGLAGERSGLWFEFRRVLDELRPQWVVIENVPGLLSSNSGRDFAVLLRGLVELRYGVCWRVLDAQYFGVAQRRRRVFIVGSLRDGRAAEVLFESEGMSGYPPTRGETGQGVADTATPLTASGRGTERAGESRGQDTLIPMAFDWQSRGDVRHNFSVHHTSALQANQTPAIAYGGNNTSGALEVETACNAHGGSGRMDFESETFIASVPPTLSKESYSPSKSSSGQQVDWAIGTASGIRRLTPTECERLQGFPDGWTAGQSDSSRYRQLGNAVAVPCAEWLARRIMALT